MTITPKSALAAVKAFSDAVGGRVADPDEVQRRLRICATCPKLGRVSGLGQVSRLLGVLSCKHAVPEDMRDRGCGVCGCSVLLLTPALEPPVATAEHPEECWLHKPEK